MNFIQARIMSGYCYQFQYIFALTVFFSFKKTVHHVLCKAKLAKTNNLHFKFRGVENHSEKRGPLNPCYTWLNQ